MMNACRIILKEKFDSQVLISTEPKDGRQDLVSSNFSLERTGAAGCRAVSAAADETRGAYQFSIELRIVYLHLLQVQNSQARQASLQCTITSSEA